MDKVVYNLKIDELKAMEYGLKRSDVTSQIQMMLRGVPVATFPRENSMDYTVRVWLPQKQIEDFNTILNTLIVTPKGKIPLNKIASLDSKKEPSIITRRDGLNYTLEVYANREKGAISHIMANLEEQLETVSIDPRVEMTQIGEQKQFKSSAKRMIGAIIVNNAILLIHFALEKMKEGWNRRDAMLESIKIRTRPVLMTAFAVSVGMLPVAQGSAIGLERLAPLGAVAIGGLVVGTLMTLIFIPIGFILGGGEDGIKEE